MPKYRVLQGRHIMPGKPGEKLQFFEKGEEFTYDDDQLDKKFKNKLERVSKPGRPKKKVDTSNEEAGESAKTVEGGKGG